MSSYGGANTRVSIPSSMRKIIQDIKEISGDHSDEDVYAMLKECSMDPNETAQRLLFLDTFHEVKRKRDKRKEIVNGRVFESSRRKPGNQLRGAQSRRGSFSCQYTLNDARSERVAAVRKENGPENNKDSDHKSPALPVLKEVETKTMPLISKTSAPVSGPTCLPNGALNDGHVVQHIEIGATVLPNHVRDAGLTKPESTLPPSKVKAEHAASSADTYMVTMQSHDSQLPTAVGAIRCEGKSHEIAAESKDSAIAERDLCNSHEFTDRTQTNENGMGKGDTSEVFLSRSPDTASAVKSSLLHASGPTKAVEGVTTKLEKLNFDEVQHVILPNHIQVPDAVKNVLSFGSLDASFAVGVNDPNSSLSNRNSSQASEFLEDENAEQPESCDEGTPTAEDEKYPDPPQAPLDVPETTLPQENNIPAPKDDQLKPETTPAIGPPYPVVQTTPSYGFGFMPSMLGSPLVQLEGLDHQARLLNSVIGNALPVSTSTPTPPPPVQSAGAIQLGNSPDFMPYAHYFPPFFMPPTIPFLGHGRFPPQLPTGNMYLPPAAAASAMKISRAYKPVTNLGNQPPPFLMPSGAFGFQISPEAGYNPNGVVTSGSSNANEGLVPSVLKESNMYLGQQSEGSTVWLPVPGRESLTLPVNSLFNLPQSPHVTISQSGHGAFAPMYHPLHTIAPPTAAQRPVQQPEPMAGPVESVGQLPPSNSLQQSW